MNLEEALKYIEELEARDVETNKELVAHAHQNANQAKTIAVLQTVDAKLRAIIERQQQELKKLRGGK